MFDWILNKPLDVAEFNSFALLFQLYGHIVVQ